jgi:hypothetical protein
MTSVNHVVMEFSVEHAHWAIWDGLGTGNISRRAQEWHAG